MGRLKPWMGVVVWLLLAVVLGLACAADKITVGTLVFLELCALILGVVVAVFWRKMANPPESVEQMLYETDHPAQK
jgi:hypothetical protein